MRGGSSDREGGGQVNEPPLPGSDAHIDDLPAVAAPLLLLLAPRLSGTGGGARFSSGSHRKQCDTGSDPDQT